jgi:hypothetical protein
MDQTSGSQRSKRGKKWAIFPPSAAWLFGRRCTRRCMRRWLRRAIHCCVWQSVVCCLCNLCDLAGSLNATCSGAGQDLRRWAFVLGSGGLEVRESVEGAVRRQRGWGSGSDYNFENGGREIQREREFKRERRENGGEERGNHMIGELLNPYNL